MRRDGGGRAPRKIPRFYPVHLGQRHFETGTVTVLPFERVCADLDLP